MKLPRLLIIGAMKALPELTPFDTTIRLDDGPPRRLDTFNVFVANGHHWDARWPEPPFAGQGEFEGMQMHAHDYKTPDVLEGKRVLVLGIGNSATDIAVESSRVADETFLAWARQRYACVVLNLHVDHHPAGLAAARRQFRGLIDLARARGGTYFLTYHRWATREQLDACHPQLPAFLRRKLAHDPAERFQSEWYRHLRGLYADVL